jgi:hypothetical protein
MIMELSRRCLSRESSFLAKTPSLCIDAQEDVSGTRFLPPIFVRGYEGKRGEMLLAIHCMAGRA